MNIPIFSTTEPSFFGLESPPKSPMGSPKFTGFESDAFIASYAHSTLESELGFDIIALVDGELLNVPEQAVIVVDGNGKRTEAIALMKRQSNNYSVNIRHRWKYTLYAVLTKDVEETKKDMEKYV